MKDINLVQISSNFSLATEYPATVGNLFLRTLHSLKIDALNQEQ